MPTLSPSKVVVCVPTPVGIVRKVTSIKEAFQLKTVTVGLKIVDAPIADGKTIAKEAIAQTCWSNQPSCRDLDVKARMQQKGLRAHSYDILPVHIVPIQQTQAQTRLEAALRRYQSTGKPFIAEPVIEEAAVLKMTVINQYPDFWRRLLEAAIVSQGGSRHGKS